MPSRHPAAVTATVVPLIVLCLSVLLLAAGALGAAGKRAAGGDSRKDALHAYR